MKYRCFLGLSILMVGLFLSCETQRLSKKDYPFYTKDYVLNPGGLLRTDGAYLLKTTWINEDGKFIKKIATAYKVYKFYKTGQSNLIVIANEGKKTTEDLKEALNNSAVEGAATHRPTMSEGYFKVINDRIIIQSLTYPDKQSAYNFGYLKPDSLIILRGDTEYNKVWKDKDFEMDYREAYVFIPFNTADMATPDW